MGKCVRLTCLHVAHACKDLVLHAYATASLVTKLDLSQWRCICAEGRRISEGSVLPEALSTKAYFEKNL